MHRLSALRRAQVSFNVRRWQSSLRSPKPLSYPTTAFLRSLPHANSALSSSQRTNARQTASNRAGHAPFEEIPNHPWSLVIFDKDGTLFDVSATWRVWAEHIGASIRVTCDSAAEGRFYETMGFDPVTGQVHGTGKLATRPWSEINDCIAIMLSSCASVDLEEASTQVMRWTREVDMGSNQQPLFDVKALFTQLRSMGIKVHDSCYACSSEDGGHKHTHTAARVDTVLGVVLVCVHPRFVACLANVHVEHTFTLPSGDWN
eukprot:TRINITY_DN9725_c0_g2_i2.p1 TRINITY_DN9725_c0_g2~~TRINITY_DN9725_c0_g2_i2.p1  ORF type:complete len:260 (+),score=26.03 TRINITY_DN9725_c0_g2_i2:273-1052(+)